MKETQPAAIHDATLVESHVQQYISSSEPQLFGKELVSISVKSVLSLASLTHLYKTPIEKFQ